MRTRGKLWILRSQWIIMLKKKRRKRLISTWIWQFRVRAVIVQIVLEALATVPAKLSKTLKKLEIKDVIGSL